MMNGFHGYMIKRIKDWGSEKNYSHSGKITKGSRNMPSDNSWPEMGDTEKQSACGPWLQRLFSDHGST